MHTTSSLNRVATAKDLNTALIYNSFPQDTDQPSERTLEPHLQQLYLLFKRWNVSEKLGIHLLHKHWDIRPGEMIYGMNHKDTISMWLTRPVLVADVPLQEVRGYNFCLLQDGNVAPYEFRRRETTVDVDPHFLEEFSDYVKENRLENILGLQVKAEHMEEMTEIVFTTWNVMLERKHVANRCEWIPTGWTADEGIHSMTAHETHALIDGKHHPVNKGAPRTIWEVESSMRNLDFLKV